MKIPIPQDNVERKVVESLNRGELHIIHVGASDLGPSFSYTIGLTQLHAHPELLITELPFQNANNVLHSAFDCVSEGMRFGHLDKALHVVSAQLPACFLQIPPEVRDKHLTMASWANGREEFDALQCVWPDRNGLFPWDAEYDPGFHQTILAETP